MKQTFFIALSSLFLASCFGGSYDDYLGYWTTPDQKNDRVMQIKKVNGEYLFDNDVFSDQLKPDVLVKKEGLLTFKGRLTPLSLSEDKNELTVSTYGVSTRISNERFNELNKIEQARIPEHQECVELYSNARNANPEAFNGAYNKSDKEREEAELALNKLKETAKEQGLISCVFLK